MAAKISKLALSAIGAQNNTLSVGDVVTVMVDFSAAVMVTGSPQLWLKIGTSLVKASYAGGSGTNQLSFTYTIKAGQNDANGISLTANSLVLNGGTIKDVGGVAATLSHAAVADNANFLVDTTAPAVVNAVTLSSAAGPQLHAGDTVTATVNFSELVTVSGTPVLWLKVGGSLVQANYVSGSGSKNLVFGYQIVAGQVDTDGISVNADSLRLNGSTIRDAAGNDAKLTHVPLADQAGLKVSAALPSALELAVDSGLVGDGLTNSAAVNVKGLAQGAGWQYQVDGGDWVAGSGSSFALSAGTHSYAVKPEGGTAITAVSFTLDQAGPTVSGVTIAGAVGAQNGRLNAGDVVTVNVVFSEAVTVSGAPRLALTVGGAVVQASYTGGSGTEQLSFTYTVQAGHNDADGIAVAANALSLNGGTITDIAGNASMLAHAALADDANYRVDTGAPVVSSVAVSSASGAQNGYLNAGDVALATVEFSEAVTVAGSVQLTLDIGGTLVQANYLAGSGTNRLTFSYAIAQGQQDLDGIAVPVNGLALARGGAIKDLAGNAAVLTHGAATADAGYKVDTTGPAISSGATAAAIDENSGAGQVVYQASASDSGSGGVSYGLKAGVGDGAAFSINSSTGAVTLTGNPDFEAQSSYAFTVVATDAAGNAAEKAVTLGVTNVNDAPTGGVTISGTAKQGEALTASNNLADADGLGTIGYQWYAGADAISGATGSTLTLAEAQVGKAITVKASYTDGHGTAEGVTSAGTAPVTQLTVVVPTFVATSANPGEAEAISLYLVNQMRHAPQTWATLSNIDLAKDFQGGLSKDLYGNAADMTPKDSLIYDDVLGKTAADYSNILTTKGSLNHYFPGIGSADAGGKTYPWTRAAYEGYAGGNVTENLAYNMTSASSSLTNEQKARTLVEQLLIDDGVAGAGHRVNILMADHSEVGFGFATGASGYSGYNNFYTTQNFGTEGSAASKPYLTGFVLNNADGNLQYNQGEGLGDVTVSIVDNTSGQAHKTTTTATGYWDFAAIGGHSYTVSASGGSFTGTATASGVVVDTGGSNGYNSRSIDFFSGKSAARVDFAVPTDHAPTGTVSIVGDALVGTTLRADTSGLADADGLGTLTYRWFVDGVEVTDGFGNGSVSPTSGTLQLSGALSANMLLALTGSAGGPFFGSSLIGHKFSVLVTYTDQAGALEAIASSSTAAVTDMNVAQAMARINDSSYAGIAISDDVPHLVAFCTQMMATADKTAYHKISEFRVNADTVINVADIEVLRVGMVEVRKWDDCFNNPGRISNGHSVVVQDTLANVLQGTLDATGRGAFQDIATRIEVTGGTIAANDLLYVLGTLPGKVHVKTGEIVTVTGLEGHTPEQLAQIVNFVGDHSAPELLSVTTVADSHSVTLTFSENLSDKVPPASAFDVMVDGHHVQPTQVSIAGKVVLLTLPQTITAEHSIALTYTAPSGADALAIEDFSGNRTASITGAAVSFAADTTAPTVVGVKILDDGSKIILTYDEELGGAVPAPGSFVVDVNSSTVPFTDQVVDVVARNNTLELTLQHRLNHVDKVTVSYADPTTGNDPSATQDVSGNDAASFTAMSVSMSNIPYKWNYDTTTGADTINGTAENDVVFANLGADEVNGGDGDDYLDGGYFVISGTDSSSNIIHGGNGDDEIYGASGADQLYGDAGNDFIYASGDADTVNGGTGADVMSGRGGSDTFVFAAGDSGQTATTLDTIRDYAKGSVGTGDLIAYSTAFTIGGSDAAATASQAAINQTSAVASFAADSGTTLDDALSDIAARFTAATDSAGEFALFKVGAAGSYYLFISDGVAGVSANDVVVQLTGVTSVGKADLTGGKLTLQDGGPVFQSATTSADGSKIILTYDQALSANAPLPENFSVSVKDSGSRVTFGDAVSSVNVNGSTVELTLNKDINYYDGVTVSYTDPTAADDDHAIQEIGGGDAISISKKSVAHSSIAVNAAVSGTASGETIYGTSGNDQIYALGGSDTVYGGDGNDILDAGLYTSSGNSVNETVSNIVYGGSGDDEIYGGKGADTLYGGAGSDVLVGYYEHDVLIGGTGGDYLAGSSSTSSGSAQYNDTFIFAPGDSGQTVASIDSILDLKKGAVGTGDLIQFVQDSGASSFTGISMAVGGSVAALTADSASINQTTGVATFAAGSGTTLTDALHDVAASLTGATDSAGEFAFFKVNGAGDYYLLMSDGNAGVSANDVVVQLVGVSSIGSIDLTGGNLTILS